MPPRKSITLTEAELRLMKLLWARGDSAVGDLVAAIPDDEALAYTSVLTTVRILERRRAAHSSTAPASRSMRRAGRRFGT
jgi:predicted transcriptional regulator